MSKVFKVYGDLEVVAATDTVTYGTGLVNGVRVQYISNLLPTAPPELSTLTLSMDTYTANKALGGGAVSSASNVYQIATNLPETEVTGQFYNHQSGSLTAYADTVSSGSITLTTGSNVGTNGHLQILTDTDYYVGQSGKAGIYNVLTAKVAKPSTAMTPSNTTQHSFQLVDTNGGSSNTVTYFLDNPTTPSVTASSITAVSTAGNVYISGVPSLSTTDTVSFSATAHNAVGQFYNTTNVAYVNDTGSYFNSSASGAKYLPGSSPTADTDLACTMTLSPLANKYSESVTFNVFAVNSIGTTSAASVPTGGTLRIDTVSQATSSGSFLNETDRISSSTGQYPAINGSSPTAFDRTVSIATNEELQLLNGLYRYPPATNYSGFTPAGPNYSAISGGSYSGYRWVTFRLGAISNVTNIGIQLLGATGFTNIIESNFKMYFWISSSPVTWFDCNAAYSGTGSPSSNGDACLAYSSSTSTLKRITFGQTARSITNVIVRIGLNSSSTQRFAGVSLVA
jgi:hypothetical protein